MTHRNAKLHSFNGSVEPFDEIKFKLNLDDNWIITGLTSFNYGIPKDRWEEHSSGISVINIEHSKCTSFLCPECSSSAKINLYRIREFYHVRGYGFDTVLRVRIPRVKCTVCGKTNDIQFPLARKGVGYTIEFEKWALRAMSEKNVRKASSELSVGPWILWDILFYRVATALEKLDLKDVIMITIDETSFRKGHNYVTVITDQNKRLIFMCPGKGADTLGIFCKWLLKHNGNPKNIKVVTADMSTAFESGVKKYLPNATMVFDKFHIFKLLNDDMAVIRRRIIRTCPKEDRVQLKCTKFTVLKHPEKMEKKDEKRMKTIRLVNPELALAYDMKEAFFKIYEQNSKFAAEMYFDQWRAWVADEGCRELKIRAGKLQERLDKILSWYDYPMTNAFAEGLNSQIQKVKADGCGFTNVDNFTDFCYFRFGRLDIEFDDEV